MRKIIYQLALAVAFISCGTNSTRERELDLKEKELELKEKEIELKQKQASDSKASLDNKEKVTSAKGAPVEDKTEELIGYWFVPHAAFINIKFFRDKTFVFNDHNSVTDKDEKLTGTYDLKGTVLTLLYSDRPKQKFKFYKGKGADENYYIENSSGYYFVKGEE